MRTERPKACIECDYSGWRRVLVITEKARTVYASPCECPRGQAVTHPGNLQADDATPPPSYYEFAAHHRRLGAEVHVTDRYTSAFPLELTNPTAWAKSKAANEKAGNPYRAVLDRIQAQMQDAGTWDPDEITPVPDGDRP